MNAVTRAERARRLQETAATVAFSLDGRAVSACPGETIIEVAQREGIAIPHLCWTPGLDPAGNCRACVVEVKGERVLAASCCRQVSPGMDVLTGSERARASQRLVLELLQSDLPAQPLRRDSEVAAWAARLGVGTPRFAAREPIAPDLSHPAIAVNLDACIQCTRCVRACRDEQANDVIGLAFRGEHARIVFDIDDALGASTCVACGVQPCAGRRANSTSTESPRLSTLPLQWYMVQFVHATPATTARLSRIPPASFGMTWKIAPSHRT